MTVKEGVNKFSHPLQTPSYESLIQVIVSFIVSVFENRELRRMFGAKTEEVTGGWRILIA
jgi:hypothetical protein